MQPAMQLEHRHPLGRLLHWAAAACLLAATPALAQTPAELLDACRNETQSAAQRIGACSRLLKETLDPAQRREVLLQRGVLNEQVGDSDRAVADYSEVIKLDPASALAYFNRGNAYDQLGKHDLAIADYSQAIVLDAELARAYANRGLVYEKLKRTAEARADFERALAINAEEPDARAGMKRLGTIAAR